MNIPMMSKKLDISELKNKIKEEVPLLSRAKLSRIMWH